VRYWRENHCRSTRTGVPVATDKIRSASGFLRGARSASPVSASSLATHFIDLFKRFLGGENVVEVFVGSNPSARQSARACRHIPAASIVDGVSSAPLHPSRRSKTRRDPTPDAST
jgi:hypothetical protein